MNSTGVPFNPSSTTRSIAIFDTTSTTLLYSNISPKRDFGPDNFDAIPPHGRWQHFNVGGVPRIDDLNKQWKHDGCDRKEQARRLIDLFMVSVLLDAGAGDQWKFEEPGSGDVYTRSEGIAVASLYMFTEGAFASAGGEKHIVNGKCCCVEIMYGKLIVEQQRDFKELMKKYWPKVFRSLSITL